MGRVRWYHLVLSAYGFWLPNDPRGSWSDFVGAWELRKFGDATKVTDKRDYSKDRHDVAFRREAKGAMKYPPVRFDATQRETIGAGFGQAVSEGNYDVHACCVGHDHAHLVVGRHERTIETIAGHLKSKASMELRKCACHPLARFETNGKIPTPWSEGNWNVFIDDPNQVQSAIRYVERHPMKEGLPEQHWTFVTPLRA